LENNITQTTKRKNALNKDLSYRSLKPAKVKAEKINSLIKSGQLKDGSKFHASVENYVSNNDQLPMPDKGAITQDGYVEMHEIKSCDGADTSGKDVEWLLNQ
jgi:hypothetical protein